MIHIHVPPVGETPLYLLAVSYGPTSIHVVWDIPDSPVMTTAPPLVVATGYRIRYEGTTRGSADIDDPTAREHVLTGLRNNGTYTVAIDTVYAANPVHLGEYYKHSSREKELL